MGDNFNFRKYYQKYPITSPAYMVSHIAANKIRGKVVKYFSGKMLDIGCGDKSKRYLVGESVEEYVGLDHKDSLHDLSEVDLIGSAYNIPKGNETFDCILCTAVLEHLENPQAALVEAFRVLKSEGFAVYTVPFFWHLHEEPRDFFRYTKYGIEYLFKTAGFEILEISPMSGFWVTWGSELNYYLSSTNLGPLKYCLKFILPVNNVVFRFLDKIDRKIHRGSDRWTWMYIVVVRKP